MNSSEKQPVRLIDRNGNAVRILTGDYRVEYEPEHARIVIYSQREGKSKGFLALVPGGESPCLPVLRTEHVRNVSVEEGVLAVTVDIEGRVEWVEYSVSLSFPHNHPGLIISRVRIRITRDTEPAERHFSGNHYELSYHATNPYSSPSMIYYLNGTPGSFTYHTVDEQGAIVDLNQFIFFGDRQILNSTVFAYVDFTSLSSFYENTGTELLDTVRQPPGCLRTPSNTYMAQPFVFGYDIPESSFPLKEGTEMLVTNTIIHLLPGAPEIRDTIEYSKRFIRSAASVYAHIEKPEPSFINWPEIVEKGIDSLFEYQRSPGSHAVVSHQTNLNSIKRYSERFQSDKAKHLVENAEELFPEYKPGLPFGDAWQYLFSIIMAGEYAREFSSTAARNSFLDAAADVVDVGRKLGYVFPLRINEDYTKDEEVRYEYDCTGAYVYLMLLYHAVTGEDLYLNEAKAAGDRMMQMGFEFPYEFTTSSLAPVALLRLHKLTGDARYIDASYIPVAAAVRHSWFFNPGYGVYKGRTIFLLTEGMPGVYANGWEEATMLHYLYLYLSEGFDLLMPEVIHLISELLRFKCFSLADSLAPLLPDKFIVYNGIPREWHIPVNKNWYIPLEGFGYLEWDKSGLHDKPGRVSQPPYCFGALPEAALLQFHPLSSSTMLYTQAPVIMEKLDQTSITFKVLAYSGSFEARIIGCQKELSSVKIRCEEDGEQLTPKYDDDTGAFRFTVAAGKTYRIMVKVS